MRLNWYRLRGAGVAVALLLACTEDPTASLAGNPAGVFLAFNYLEVDVDGSATVDAVVRDGSGTPLNIPVSVTSSDNQIAVATAAQDPPHVLTRVTVQGANVGTARVIATAAGLADTMNVATFAARLVVTDLGPVVGTVVSGQTKSFSYRYESASGRDLTAQVAAPTWAVDESDRATVDPATGTITGKDFGSVSVTATGPGSGEDGLTGSASVFVQPAAFQGTFTPGTSGNPTNPSGIITITPGAGPAFDTDTRVFLNRAEVPAGETNSEGDSVVSVAPTAIQVFLGDLRAPGKLELVLAGVGATQLSVGTGPLPTDSIDVALPALGGTATPSPVDPGGVLSISAGAGPAFDADTRVYLNGVRVSTAASAVERVVSVTATTITVQTNDLRSAGAVDLRLTRVGTGQAAQAGSFAVGAPAAFTGVLSATGGTPAQRLTITRAAGGLAFDADTRVFFDGIEAFIAQGGTADAITVAVPVIDKLGQVELRMTRLGTAQDAEAIGFNSPTKNYSDPFDAVNNDPGAAPVITANGDYFVVMFGGCVPPFGTGSGGADCDDWFRITNTGGTPATVDVEVTWGTDADIDLFLMDTPGNFCIDGCGGATGSDPETSSFTIIDPGTPDEVDLRIPPGQTYYIYLNLFDWHGVPHSLARVRVSGLP